MNGRTHVAIGAAVPSSLILAGADARQMAVLVVLSAAASLGPDLDHPNATATRALGSAAHRTVHGLAKAARLATSTPEDREKAERWEARGRDPDHRGLTHTGLAALAVGAAGSVLAALPLGVVFLAAVGGWMVGHVVRRFAAAGVAGAVAVLAAGCAVPAWMVGVALAGGWLSHVLADGCTRGGVPLLWPQVRRHRRWGHTRLMGDHLVSGSPGEWVVAVAAVAVLASPAMATLLGNAA